MTPQEEALISKVIGQLVTKIVQLKTENKQLRSQLQGTSPEEKRVHKSVQEEQASVDDTINKYSTKKQNNGSVNMDFTALKNAINKAKEILK